MYNPWTLNYIFFYEEKYAEFFEIHFKLKNTEMMVQFY